MNITPTPTRPRAVPPHAPLPASPSARRGIDSRTLFGDARTLVIHHAGATYQLRITQQGKLILTK